MTYDYVDAKFLAFLTEFAWVCVRVIFLRRGRGVFTSAYLFFFLAALEYYLPGCFHIACHLAAESGTRLFCSLCICRLCWGCMIHILGGVFLGVSYCAIFIIC